LQQHAWRIGDLIDRSMREVRSLLVDLRPPLLEEHGLAEALDNELRMRRSDAGLVVLRLQLGPGVAAQRWPGEVEYAAFMIAREAIANALLHAGADHIDCVLEGEAQRMYLRVVDDGNGLPAVLHRPGHLGLVGIGERARAIGARFELYSTAGRGTTLDLRWQAEPTIVAREALSAQDAELAQ